MTLPDLAVLGILPIVVWASIVFATRSNGTFAASLRRGWGARTKQDLVEGAHSWAIFVLIVFFVVFVCVAEWIHVQDWDPRQVILNPRNWGRGTLHGIFLGLTLMGLLLIFRRHFPEARKFSLLVMAGIESPFVVRVAVLLSIVFTEELWRAVCLKTLIGDGISGTQALIATSIAYGLAYIAWGVSIAVSESVVGAACGGLFLWSGSFFVPFAAHAILLGQILLYAVAAAPDAQAGNFDRRPFTKCPVCGAMLSVGQVNLNPNEAFFCPSCHTRITVSDSRRGFFRWGFIFVSTGLLVASWDIFPDAVGGSAAQYFLSLAVTFCAGIALWLLIQVVFPPKLECGDADVIALNLADRDTRHSVKEIQNNPRKPDPN